MVLDNYEIKHNEPIWKKRSTVVQGATVKLAIEVVNTNWQDDYLMKLGEYEKLKISEYWIVDYLGLGGKRYIGSPKQPTVSIYHLVEREYTVELFQNQDCLKSPWVKTFGRGQLNNPDVTAIIHLSLNQVSNPFHIVSLSES